MSIFNIDYLRQELAKTERDYSILLSITAQLDDFRDAGPRVQNVRLQAIVQRDALKETLRRQQAEIDLIEQDEKARSGK